MASLGCCDRTWACVRSTALQIFNVLDLVSGCLLIAGGSYLRTRIGGMVFTDLHTAWLALSTLVLGVMLVIVSFLSFCAVMNQGCRWMIYPSGFIALLIAILSLALASAALAEKKKVFNYLDSNYTDLGLEDDELDLFKTWYQIIAYGLFGLFAIEVCRFRASMNFRETQLRLDGEFDALLAEDDRRWNDKITNNKADRANKYDDLRSHYKMKYSTSAINGQDSSSSNSNTASNSAKSSLFGASNTTNNNSGRKSWY